VALGSDNVKTQLSSHLMRLLKGGVNLTPVEGRRLKLFQSSVPSEIQIPFDRQIAAYNLVQREIDGRALNFYRIRRWKVYRDDLPKLPVNPGEVKLLSMELGDSAASNAFYATFWVVDGYFFSINLSESIEHTAPKQIRIRKVKQCWRSNLVLGTDSSINVEVQHPPNKWDGADRKR